ncbi:MAG: chromate transporter [Syntrophales bacterium]
MTAFGGPVMVAYIRQIAVNRRQWLDESEFRNGVALCQSLPGATAMQVAAYVGLRSNGITGALASYVGFGLPAFVIMLVLSVLYINYKSLPTAVSLFNGLQVIVIAIIVNAVYSFGRGMIKSIMNIAFALSFLDRDQSLHCHHNRRCGGDCIRSGHCPCCIGKN